MFLVCPPLRNMAGKQGFLVCPPLRNMAGKQGFLVCLPLEIMARKQCFLVCPPLGNMARKQCFLVCPPLENMAGKLRAIYTRQNKSRLQQDATYIKPVFHLATLSARTGKKVGTVPTCSRRIFSPANFNQSRCRILVFASRRANKVTKWKTGFTG